jgi:hypothetical protein
VLGGIDVPSSRPPDSDPAGIAGRPVEPTPSVAAGRHEPRLLERVRLAIRTRHYSPRTEKSYVAWVRRFVLFHDKRHPIEMGSEHVTRFLTHRRAKGG